MNHVTAHNAQSIMQYPIYYSSAHRRKHVYSIQLNTALPQHAAYSNNAMPIAENYAYNAYMK